MILSKRKPGLSYTGHVSWAWWYLGGQGSWTSEFQASLNYILHFRLARESEVLSH